MPGSLGELLGFTTRPAAPPPGLQSGSSQLPGVPDQSAPLAWATSPAPHAPDSPAPTLVMTPAAAPVSGGVRAVAAVVAPSTNRARTLTPRPAPTPLPASLSAAAVPVPAAVPVLAAVPVPAAQPSPVPARATEPKLEAAERSDAEGAPGQGESGRRHLALVSRMRRRQAPEDFGTKRAPAEPVVEESVRVISRTPRRGAAPGWAPSPAAEVAPPATLAPTPAAEEPPAAQWAPTPAPAAPAPVPWPPSPQPTPAPAPTPWAPAPAVQAPPWPPRPEAEPAAGPEPPAWRGVQPGTDPEVRRDLGSTARRTAMMVGSRAREAILGYPFPSPEPPSPAPYAGAEPPTGQTVVLVGDDVEAWVRERLYGGRLPSR